MPSLARNVNGAWGWIAGSETLNTVLCCHETASNPRRSLRAVLQAYSRGVESGIASLRTNWGQ